MPPVENLYPNRGNQAKRVEKPRAAVRKSLPEQRKSTEKVENPSAARRKSLPKQRKSAEKVENPMIYHLLFTNSNTVYARNRTVYAKGVLCINDYVRIQATGQIKK